MSTSLITLLTMTAGVLAGTVAHQRLAPRLADNDGTGSSIRLELLGIIITIITIALIAGTIGILDVPLDPRPSGDVITITVYQRPTA